MLVETSATLSKKLVYLEAGTTTVLKNVRLIDGTGAAPRDGVTVVIEGDRIARIEAAPSEPVETATSTSVRVYDGSGHTVIPGLIDLHVHFTGDVGRSREEQYAVDMWQSYRDIRAVWHAAQTLEAGFTTVRVLGHGRPEIQNGLRRAVAEGLIPGPRMLTAGWSISQTGGHGDPHLFPQEVLRWHRPRSAFADGPVECRRLVRENFAEGADCIKIYTTEGGAFGNMRALPNFTREEIEAMTDEAHVHGAHVASHAVAPEGVRNAVLGGVDTIEHGGTLWDAPDVVDLMIERGTFLVPTLTVFEFICQDRERRAGLDAENAGLLCRWLEDAKTNLRPAMARGLKVACGTDSRRWAGDNARELGLLVESGFSPMEAIVAATHVSAQALRLDDHIGTLQPGKVGELLVLSIDPLANIDAIRQKDNIKWIFKTRDQLTLGLGRSTNFWRFPPAT